MALTEQEINFNYNQAIQKANELSELLKCLSDASGTIMSTAMALKFGWQGNNADEFMRRCDSESRKIQGTRSKLEKLIAAIKNMAEEVKQAELNALAIARERERLANMAKMAASSAGRTTGAVVAAATSSSNYAPKASKESATSYVPKANKASASSSTVQTKSTKTSTSIPTSVLNAMAKSSSKSKR